MRRTVMATNPAASQGMLIVAFLVYVPLCAPVIGRRRTELDPFYHALPWLWIAPVLLSAPFGRLSRLRVLGLAAYALATAVVMGGCYGPYARPRHVSIGMMLAFGLVFWGPIHLAAAALTEAVSRCVLRWIRVFPDRPPDGRPDDAIQDSPSRLTRYFIAVIAIALVFPFAFRAAAFGLARRGGREWAESDWQDRTPLLFLDFFDPEVSVGDIGCYDPVTGLQIDFISLGDLRRASCKAYNEAIAAKIAEFGPMTIVRRLFTLAELSTFLGSTEFAPVGEFPQRPGQVSIGREEMGGGSLFVATAPSKGDVLVVVGARWLATYHPDGRMLQRVTNEHKGIAWTLEESGPVLVEGE